MYPNSKRGILSNIVAVDNRQGMGAMIHNKANEYDMETVDITIKDVKVYGEFGSPDCPQDG